MKGENVKSMDLDENKSSQESMYIQDEIVADENNKIVFDSNQFNVVKTLQDYVQAQDTISSKPAEVGILYPEN